MNMEQGAETKQEHLEHAVAIFAAAQPLQAHAHAATSIEERYVMKPAPQAQVPQACVSSNSVQRYPVTHQVVYAPAAITSGKAVGSLVCGIIGLFCFGICLGPVAICLGVQAKREIRESNGRIAGECQAIGGIVTGIVSVVVWIIFLVLFCLALIGFALVEDDEGASEFNYSDDQFWGD